MLLHQGARRLLGKEMEHEKEKGVEVEKVNRSRKRSRSRSRSRSRPAAAEAVPHCQSCPCKLPDSSGRRGRTYSPVCLGTCNTL